MTGTLAILLACLLYPSSTAAAGKGWGAMAQEVGIKPGSAEFHALKRGDLHFGAPPASHGDVGEPGHGHGKGKHGR